LEEIEDSKKAFQNHLTFSIVFNSHLYQISYQDRRNGRVQGVQVYPQILEDNETKLLFLQDFPCMCSARFSDLLPVLLKIDLK
jgi:hypothetical protein